MVTGTTHHSTIGTTSAKHGHTTVSSTLVQQPKADYREPIDSDDESDDSNYAEFLSFLQTPSPTQTKKVMDNEPVVQAVIVEGKSGVPAAVAAPVRSVKKAERDATVSSAMKIIDTSPTKQMTKTQEYDRKSTASTSKASGWSVYEDEMSIEDEEGSEWSSSKESESEDEEFAALLAAPVALPKSYEETSNNYMSKSERVPRSKSMAQRDDTAQDIMPVEPPPHLPKSASVATLHFALEKIKREKEIEDGRAQVSTKEPLEPLPVDYFTKEGEKEMEAKAAEAAALAEAEMPIAVKKMTAKAEADKIAYEAEMKAVSEAQMSAATRHFHELEAKKLAEQTAVSETEIMPAAIQHFTMMARDERAKKRASLQEMKENPPPMPDGIDYFTKKADTERERKAAELAELKANPPPASVATEYFAKKESQRQLEIEAMMNEPAPAAIEYFTNKAREEKSKRDLMLKEMNENPPEPSVATQYFARQESIKAAEIEAARSQVKNKEPLEPLPIDYFTKEAEREMAVRAESARQLAESQMPIAVKKMTAKAEADKIARDLERRELSERNMSAATRHFKEIEDEKIAQAAANAKDSAEIMPAAIQRFTMMDREKRAEKRASLQEMKENPPPMPDGIDYFTTKANEERERKAAELAELKANPPPASVATEYFAKKESQRQLEIEAMMNEPAPAAIEYFTNKAREEKSKRDLMLKEMNENPPEPSVATQHFDMMQAKEEADIMAAREASKRKLRESAGSSQRLVDWAQLTQHKAPSVPAY